LKSKREINKETSAKEYCSWEEVDILTKTIAQKIRNSNKKYDAILGITNGGIIPAMGLAKELEINDIRFIPFRNKKLYTKVMPILSKDKKYLIVDEIYDTGETLSKVDNVLKKFDYDFTFLMSRYRYNGNGKPFAYVGKLLNHNKWIVFPWELKNNH
jgi:hypoxanthine phosphoribosyltransferase